MDGRMTHNYIYDSTKLSQSDMAYTTNNTNECIISMHNHTFDCFSRSPGKSLTVKLKFLIF